MSYFYLKPAKGEMPMYLLEEIVQKRLEYLQCLSRGNTALYNQYVIEGSAHDNIGHFILCILSSILNNADFTHFLLNTEVKMFKQRITPLPAYDLRCFAKKLLQIVRKLDSQLTFIKPLQQLCRHLSLRNIASHICSSSHSECCAIYNMKLHFKNCLSFIAERQVEVANGFAFIPCGKWRTYLVELFKTALLHRISQSKDYAYENDPRLMQLLLTVKKTIPLIKYPNMKVLLSKDVDKTVQYFPPCMSNLHWHLRSKHRLSHDQRFHYSLFLKDIGMPVEEAMEFWKAEYSQIPIGDHKCMHNWEKDEKKFVYGIRHMYGLEGGRKNYSSVNCQRIQHINYSCHEGGCPFKSFDDINMIKSLKLDNSEPLLSQVFYFKRKGMYTSACLSFLEKSLKTEINCDRFSIDFSPTKYFSLAYEDL